MSKNRQKEINRSMMRYGVSDDKAGHVRSTGVLFSSCSGKESVCICICVGEGEYSRWRKLGEVLKENKGVKKSKVQWRDGAQTESVPE